MPEQLPENIFLHIVIRVFRYYDDDDDVGSGDGDVPPGHVRIGNSAGLVRV